MPAAKPLTCHCKATLHFSTASPHSPQAGTTVATTMAAGSPGGGSWPPTSRALSSWFSPLWVRSCFRRLEDTTKALPQRPHLKGRSLARSAKLLPHSPHWWGRCPECTSRWRLRSQEATKLLSHCAHLWGRSPVWMRWCMARSAGWRKALPWWARWCRRKLEGSLNMRPHCGQRKGFSPEWVRWWLWKEESWVKPLPHRLQR
uniref:Uncharacterized protein n=1 Tax=Varanus komodoensis TaxID=61221 RepID=A0A8D2IV46_VARKO